MALQTTGKISLSDIQTLFGGTNPITMSEYYNNNASGFTTGVTGIPNSGATISISHFYGKAKSSSNSLYGFTAHTFTNAGATGRTGPIISQVRSAYSTASWAQNSTYLNMTTQGIQEWTVPATGSYTIASLGALGAGTGSYYGGNGANITGTFNLTKGDVLCIVIGQKGITGPNSGGAGGGGSFVYRKTDNLLYIVAGGGGGGGHDVGFGGGGSANQTPVNGGGSGNGGYQGIGYGGNGGGNSTNYVNSEWNDSAGGGGGWLSNGNNGGAILNMDYMDMVVMVVLLDSSVATTQLLTPMVGMETVDLEAVEALVVMVVVEAVGVVILVVAVETIGPVVEIQVMAEDKEAGLIIAELAKPIRQAQTQETVLLR